jgi:hypothetical protein
MAGNLIQHLQRTVAAITISKACMTKLARAANMHRFSRLFLSISCQLTHHTNLMVFFFLPLFSEIEDIYVYGTQVFFKLAVPGYSPANDAPTLRLVPLLCTADLRPHSEIGLTSAGGRRCEVIGTYMSSSNHYYYEFFLYRYHNPPPHPSPRTACQNRFYG